MNKEVMQDSGVEWIGDIPQGWRVDSLKRLLDSPLKYGANEAAELDDRALPRYIRITDFDHDGLLKDSSFKSLPLDKAAGYYLKNGDILFARSGATVGKTFIFYGEDKKACFAGYLIKASTNRYLLSPEFLYFYTKSSVYDIWKNSIFTQATIQNIGADKYAYLPMVVPPLTEQQAITQYLEHRCGKLDAIIAIKQQQINTLNALRQSIIFHAVTKGLDDSIQLVDSGVEWLGKIPQGWKVQIIKRVFDIKLGKMLQPLQKSVLDTEEYYLKTSNIYWEGVEITKINTMWFSPLDKSNTELQYNDLLVCEGGDVGRSALWKEEITPCYIQNAINRVRPIHDCSTKFLYYWLFLLKHTGYIDAMVSRITIAHLTAEKLERLIFLLPPLSEQQHIADHLDHEIQQLNDLKSNLNQQITTLDAYKKALIYECVTGKKRINAETLKAG